MEDLREEFRRLKNDRSLTQSDVARGIGCSVTVISQWLQGAYKGDNSSLDAKIRSYFELVRDRDPLARRTLEFVRTSVSGKVWEVARECHRDGVIGLVTGESGLGKTRAIKEYAESTAGVIVIEAHLSYRTRDVIRDLHLNVGLSGEGSVHRMLVDLKDKLRRSGRLIIVDEAEHLSASTLDELRRLNDWSHVGLLYVGLPRFAAALSGLRKDFAYITNRVRIPATLKRLKERDTEALVKTMLPEDDGAGLYRLFHQEAGGNARRLEVILYNSLRVAELNERPVDEHVIREVSKALTV